MNTTTTRKAKVRTSVCPVCGKTAYLAPSRNHGIIWKCFSCNDFFAPGEGGTLTLPTPCPKCGKQRLGRFELQLHPPGRFFHFCGACQELFYDENGQPGQPFGPETRAVYGS